MSTKWVVTAAAERIELGAKRTGETTFTVTNPNGTADRAVFDPVIGEGADASWFTVDEPQRQVRGGASVSYVMKVAVPADAPSGEYAVQGRVYSADWAPEESSVLSPRVMLAVPAPPEPTKRKWPRWWWLVAAGLALVLLIGIGVLVFQLAGDDGSSGSTQAPTPAPTPGVGELVMPDLLGMPERDALQALSDAGLTVRPIKYRHDPERADQVVQQSIEGNSVVRADAVVDLEVAVALTPPAVKGPAGVPMLEADSPPPTLEWEAGQSPARRWQLTWYQERCSFRPNYSYYGTAIVVSGCHFPATDGLEVVDATSFTPGLSFDAPDFGYQAGGDFHTGWVRWQVAALDDFGVAGPPSEPAYFRMAMS